MGLRLMTDWSKKHPKYWTCLGAQLRLVCPRCNQYKRYERPSDRTIPDEVTLIEIICPGCDDGDRHSETWFDAFGCEVSQNLQNTVRAVR